MERVLDEYYGDDANNSVICPSWAPIVGFTGITFAVVFASEYKIRGARRSSLSHLSMGLHESVLIDETKHVLLFL